MFANSYSCIAIKDNKLYIVSTKHKDFSLRAITIINGFQIELGRKMSEIREALEETRLPIMIKEVVNDGDKAHYQIIRMHTGKVDDRVVATVICSKDIMRSISFNRALIKDSEYRKYNKLSVMHQISMPFDPAENNCSSRLEQINKLLSSILPLTNPLIVSEDGNQLTAITNEEELKLKFKFILNKSNNNRYELISISLA